MKLAEIARRMTGLNIGPVGVSWEPPDDRRDAARRTITYLEDRRVLYAPEQMEVPDHCVRSVLEIRQWLTRELQGGAEDDLTASLRAMRSACRKFLDACSDPQVVRYGRDHGHWASWRFNGALGEMRGVFGVHVAGIAVRYGLEVEDQLAVILPAAEQAEDER